MHKWTRFVTEDDSTHPQSGYVLTYQPYYGYAVMVFDRVDSHYGPMWIQDGDLHDGIGADTEIYWTELLAPPPLNL